MFKDQKLLERNDMTFEENLRERIKKSPINSVERTVLKVVLGEIQQKSASKAITEEQCHSIVKGMVASNKENLGFLQSSDPRYDKYVEENDVLNELLPKYLTVDQITERLTASGIDFKAVSEGQATGKAMQFFKAQNAPVEGQTVKQVVAELRK